MQEMENDRNYNKQNEEGDQFNRKVSIANEKQKGEIEEVNKKNIRNDNDFFKQLYKNNSDDLSLNIDSSQNQNYMSSINEDDDMDSLYSNDNMNNAKDSLLNEDVVNQTDIDKYIKERSEMASNYEENINMNIDNSTKVNSEDIESLLKQSVNTEEQTKEFMNKTLKSTNRVFERRKKRVLTIDISNFLSDVSDGRPAINNYTNNYWEHFKVNFQEEFIIDKISDVFLESITINNPAQANNFCGLYKVLDIAEFNVQTTTNNIFMKDKFVLPNENTASSGTNKIMKYHLKSNYIATVNPQKLASLTFKLTNEDNYGVGVSLTAPGSLVANAAGYDAGIKTAVAVDDGTQFNVLDAVYNGNKQFLGIITYIDTNNLYFGAGTHVSVLNDEKLYIADTTFRSGVLSNGAVDIGSTSITVGTVDATTIFNIGDKVYLGNGALMGTLSDIASTTLTFSSGISHNVPTGINMYINNPLPKVFASDNPLNRIIMEFMFISR